MKKIYRAIIFGILIGAALIFVTEATYGIGFGLCAGIPMYLLLHKGEK